MQDSDYADLGPLDGLQLDGAVDPEEQVRREVVSVVELAQVLNKLLKSSVCQGRVLLVNVHISNFGQKS